MFHVLLPRQTNPGSIPDEAFWGLQVTASLILLHWILTKSEDGDMLEQVRRQFRLFFTGDLQLLEEAWQEEGRRQPLEGVICDPAIQVTHGG